MTKKVILPLEVAGALEELRGEGISNFGIITGMSENGHGAFNTLNQWSYGNGCRKTDELLSAIINGYEVEEYFSDLTDTGIYLGLLALANTGEKDSMFLVEAAKAFKRNSNRVIELWEELKVTKGRDEIDE